MITVGAVPHMRLIVKIEAFIKESHHLKVIWVSFSLYTISMNLNVECIIKAQNLNIALQCWINEGI